MKLIVLVAAVLASAASKPSIVAPIAYTAYAPIAAPIAISSQYQAQDELGQYNYGYANPLSSKAEVRTVDGITRGGYSYLDAEGRVQSVQYTSDASGFRVAASNLPVAPEVPKVEPLPQPAPVEDTPEVAAAKAKHLAALNEAKVRAEAPVVATTSVVSAAPAAVVAAPAIQTYAYGIQAPVISTYGYTAYPSISTYAAPYIISNAVAPAVVNNAATPVPPVDTPEVAKARAEHLAAVAADEGRRG